MVLWKRRSRTPHYQGYVYNKSAAVQTNFHAIVLTHQDHKERDRLYTFFTREVGKIVVRGSGARKSGAKLAPHLEPLMVSSIVVAKNRGRGTVTFALCEESFRHLRNHPQALRLARNSCDTAERFLRNDDPQEHLYDLVLIYLRTMDALAAHNIATLTLRTVTYGFLTQLLSHLGWHIESRRCVHCKDALQEQATYRYSLSEGGFFCATCQDNTHIAQQQSITLSRNTVVALRLFHTNSIPSLAKVTVSQDVCDELANFSMRRIAWVS